MRILYIDTSSSFLYAGISEQDHLLCEVKKEFGHNLSEESLPSIAELFNKANLNPKDIDKIIVVNGPGSFTGIRIGITIAKVYAWSLGIPITTISSLEAMMLSSKKETVHVPVIDARRKYVFAGIYNKDYEQLLAPQYITLEKLQNKLQEFDAYSIITNDDIEEFPKSESYDPDIMKIINKFKDKEPVNPHAVNPEYLKLTEAEENRQN